ncbi:MAG: ABC transporter ATP-binding protein [Nitrospirota bacterium]|nr:ABC transporter ATP-binding protein [Nitrospirota bacterium]MDP2384659.1 ABC transporter ATP-binding protein [Nitrospirota bacterium]
MTTRQIDVTHSRLSEERPAIEVLGLSFQYRTSEGRGRMWTLDHLSFHVDTGEILGIVGPNGSGKTSLLKVLSGLLPAGEGDVRLGGLSLRTRNQTDIARVVAVVPQEYVQVFPFTVAETVLMGRFPHRTTRWWSLGIGDETANDLACAHQSMVDTDVLSLADRLVSDLSGGERQRVMIARALAQEPKILLLDEPTAFLDINHQIEICSLIARLKTERRLTVVLVSHDLNVASQYCDRVLMLKDGGLCRIGSPEETIRPDVLRMVYGCDVVVDAHPQTGRPRVTMPMNVVLQ